MTTTAEPSVTRALRRVLLALALLGVFATATELALIGHWGSPARLIPWALLLLAGVTLLLAAWKPGVRTLWSLRVALVIVALGSGVGVLEHAAGNLVTAREVAGGAALPLRELVLGALTGGAPALAPGILVQVALLGLAFTYRHPALRTASRDVPLRSGTIR